MTNHPSRPHDDDPTEADALARVNRMRAARGLEPIVERDPAQALHRLGVTRDAMTVALWALRRHGGNVPESIDSAAERCPTCGIGNLPIDVALALLARVPSDHRTRMHAALGDVLADWKRRPDQFTRPRIELTVWRLEEAVRTTLAVAITADGSGAQMPGFTGPAPEPTEQLATAAETAAAIAIGQLIERLQTDLGTMAGMP